MCKAVLASGAPLSLRPLTALFMLKQQEIRDIVSVLQIKRFKREEKLGWLVMPEVVSGSVRGVAV